MLHTLRECVDAGRELEDRRAHGNEHAFYQTVHDLLREGQIRAGQVSLSNLFEAFVPDGRELLESFRPGFNNDPQRTMFMEAGDAVTTTAFSNIIGQITYSTVLEALESPDNIAMSLVTEDTATTQLPEIIPGISMIGDRAQDTGEDEDYPRVGLTEEFITIPEKIKDGFILPLTEEAIWEDKTGGLLTRRANAAADSMRITQEKEGLDVILGITTSYSRNGGPKQATYADTHTQGDFDNLQASNALVNETDVETALLLFDDMTDPNTGEPISLSGQIQLIVPTALDWTAAKIITATEVRDTAGSATRLSAPAIQNSGRRRTFSHVTSQYVKNRTGSATTWFVGDPQGAFGYRVVWPIQVFRQDRNSEAGFSRDVVTQVKVRRKGVFYVREPRKMIKCTA